MTHLKFSRTIEVTVEDKILLGELCIPADSSSLVIFSHGSGSNRLSKRNYFVAKKLQEKQISTLLFDLLTKEEDEKYENRFNIDLLTTRLIAVTNYIRSLPECGEMQIGYFGASTGAASALKAAAALPDKIKAVVSRGGRPDLAMGILTRVKAPTLLIVGDLDFEVLFLNSQVYKTLTCPKKLDVIIGATHQFEEPGKLDEVASHALQWFSTHLSKIKSIKLQTKT